MSNRAGTTRTALWWVRPIDCSLRTEETQGHLFAGCLEDMVKHINAVELETGKRQACRQMESHGKEEVMSFANEQVEQLARAAFVGDRIFAECGSETLTRRPQKTLIKAWNALPEEDRTTFRRVVCSTFAPFDHRG